MFSDAGAAGGHGSMRVARLCARVRAPPYDAHIALLADVATARGGRRFHAIYIQVDAKVASHKSMKYINVKIIERQRRRHMQMQRFK